MYKYTIDKMKKIILFLALAAFITSCGDEKQITPIEEDPVKVTIGQSSASQQDGYIEVSGMLEAADIARVSTRMMGFIENIRYDVGDRVRKGQVLVNINTADLQAQLARVGANIAEAEAARESAQLDYDRFKNLFESNSATRKELENVTTQLKMAQSRVKAAEEARKEVEVQFAYANITSPISGTVVQKMANEGDMASPGMPILEIESGKKLEVAARVPESDISKITMNEPVEVTIKSVGQTINGKVTEIAPSAKYSGGQYLVKISLDNPPGELKSGMYATVRMEDDGSSPTQAFMIPESALVKQGQLTGVYVVSDSNKALLRWLRLGSTNGDMVEVLSGLSPDEKYIVSAESKLYNGVPVITQ
jgi:RND family efflux transporter MFP subunit